jgi:ABC-type sugar transport system ATPase subunit
LAADAPWLRAESVTKVYGGVHALREASVGIRRGEIRGLVGANGAGKSTLVGVLTGMVAPTDGRVVVDGRRLAPGRPQESLRAGISAVPQELTVAPTMTVAENVMLGHEPRGRLRLLDRRRLRREAQDVLDTLELGIHPDRPAGELPLIEQRLLMIARALSTEARMVIFDEPTATVSPREVDLLLRTIRGLAEQGVAVLYVSHRLEEVELLCESVTVLRDGSVVAELGRPTRAQLVELLASGTERTAAERREPPGDVVLRLRGLESERLRGVDLDVRAGEIVGLAGLVGSGARDVLLAVCGAMPRRGEVTLGGRRLASRDAVGAVAAGVAFLPGNRNLGAFPAHTVRENVSLPTLRGLFVRRREERTAVQQLLDRVSLRADPDAPMSSLSGGNQQKAIVARWIGAGARVLLLDDPTSGVDVSTRPELHRQVLDLAAAGAAVLLVTTEIEEFAELADRVVILDRGRVAGELAGADLTPSTLLTAMTEKGATT